MIHYINVPMSGSVLLHFYIDFNQTWYRCKLYIQCLGIQVNIGIYTTIILTYCPWPVSCFYYNLLSCENKTFFRLLLEIFNKSKRIFCKYKIERYRMCCIPSTNSTDWQRPCPKWETVEMKPIKLNSSYTGDIQVLHWDPKMGN